MSSTRCRQHFRPEFLNRIDEIVIFHALTLKDLEQIVEIQLGFVRDRLAQRNIALQVTQRAKQLLAQRGFDPVFGARPLKRVIQRELLDRLAKEILNGDIRDGETDHGRCWTGRQSRLPGGAEYAEVVA